MFGFVFFFETMFGFGFCFSEVGLSVRSSVFAQSQTEKPLKPNFQPSAVFPSPTLPPWALAQLTPLAGQSPPPRASSPTGQLDSATPPVSTPSAQTYPLVIHLQTLPLAVERGADKRGAKATPPLLDQARLQACSSAAASGHVTPTHLHPAT